MRGLRLTQRPRATTVKQDVIGKWSAIDAEPEAPESLQMRRLKRPGIVARILAN